MRLGTAIGAVLLILGAFIGLRGLNYSTQRSVVKIGEFEAKVEEQRTVPVWVGGVVFFAGLGLIGYSLRRRGDA
jgi:hypothetical protein